MKIPITGLCKDLNVCYLKSGNVLSWTKPTKNIVAVIRIKEIEKSKLKTLVGSEYHK